MGYAFISYSSKNQSSADAMRELFKKYNIDTWMAPYDIPAGSKYAAVITRAIRDCSCFVLLLSNDSQASEAVDSEVELATLTFKKSIIAVELEKVILNDAFTFYIHNKQIIALHKIDEESCEIKQILEVVRTYTKDNESDKILNTESNKTESSMVFCAEEVLTTKDFNQKCDNSFAVRILNAFELKMVMSSLIDILQKLKIKAYPISVESGPSSYIICKVGLKKDSDFVTIEENLDRIARELTIGELNLKEGKIQAIPEFRSVKFKISYE